MAGWSVSARRLTWLPCNVAVPQLADVRACLQAWSIKTVMFLAGLSFVIKEDSSQLVGVTDMVAKVCVAPGYRAHVLVAAPDSDVFMFAARAPSRKHAAHFKGRFDACDSAYPVSAVASPVSSQSASPRRLTGLQVRVCAVCAVCVRGAHFNDLRLRGVLGSSVEGGCFGR